MCITRAIYYTYIYKKKNNTFLRTRGGAPAGKKVETKRHFHWYKFIHGPRRVVYVYERIYTRAKSFRLFWFVFFFFAFFSAPIFAHPLRAATRLHHPVPPCVPCFSFYLYVYIYTSIRVTRTPCVHTYTLFRTAAVRIGAVAWAAAAV